MIATFLPSVHLHSGPSVPVGGVAEPDKARQVFDMMVDCPEQGRGVLRWDEQLANLAWKKCKLQAIEGWTGHVSPSGVGPNKWLRQHGYPLPDSYSHDDGANNVESLAHNGDGTIEGKYGVWPSWMLSSGHKTHILGLLDFYAQQTQVGVGYFPLESSAKKHYWAIISCPVEE